MKTEKISKQFIEENLFRKNGALNFHQVKKINKTNEELHLIYNNLREPPKCECGKKAIFIGFAEGYRTFCSNKCSCNSETNKEKRKQTCLKKYGVGNPMQLKETQEKSKETCLRKYGFESATKSKQVIENKRQTMLKIYGVENYAQTGLNEGFYRWKTYTFPSGKVVKVQGYEPKLLDELILVFDEDEILTDRKDMPEFWYFSNDGKKHRYFPDVYIPKENTIYEVKSDWTLKQTKINGIFDLKRQTVLDNGFIFKLKVY